MRVPETPADDAVLSAFGPEPRERLIGTIRLAAGMRSEQGALSGPDRARFGRNAQGDDARGELQRVEPQADEREELRDVERRRGRTHALGALLAVVERQ